MMVNLVDYSVVAFEFAPVSSVLMCSAAAAAAMIEHQQVLMLMVLASYFYRWPPNNHHSFQIVSLVLDPIDNFDAVDMDYNRIVGSKFKCVKNCEKLNLFDKILSDCFMVFIEYESFYKINQLFKRRNWNSFP